MAQGVLQDTPLCQIALPGCTRLATEVDHKVGWKEAMALNWHPEDIDARENAQAVCASCHKTKTQAEAKAGRARASVGKPTQRHPGLRPR